MSKHNSDNEDVEFTFKPNKISRQLSSPSTSKPTIKPTSNMALKTKPSGVPQVCNVPLEIHVLNFQVILDVLLPQKHHALKLSKDVTFHK